MTNIDTELRKYTAGEALVRNDIVYLSAEDTVSKNSTADAINLIGIVYEPQDTIGDPVTILVRGFVEDAPIVTNGVTAIALGARLQVTAANVIAAHATPTAESAICVAHEAVPITTTTTAKVFFNFM